VRLRAQLRRRRRLVAGLRMVCVGRALLYVSEAGGDEL
jgi:hypothetical protein